MDNFKFMDSWPSWVRWLAVLAILVVTVVWWSFGWTYTPEWALGPLRYLWLIWTAVFLWCCIAAAPRFKVVVALLLGLFSLCAASYALFPLGPEHWKLPKGLWEFFMFLLFPYSWPYAVGFLITFVLVVCGSLRRRVGASDFAKMMPWLALGSLLFVALSVANNFIWVNKFTDLALTSPAQLGLESSNAMVFWFMVREVGLAAAALFGIWLLFVRLRNEHQQSPASLQPTKLRHGDNQENGSKSHRK